MAEKKDIQKPDVNSMFQKMGEKLGWFNHDNLDSAMKTLSLKKKHNKSRLKLKSKSGKENNPVNNKSKECDDQKKNTKTKSVEKYLQEVQTDRLDFPVHKEIPLRKSPGSTDLTKDRHDLPVQKEIPLRKKPGCTDLIQSASNDLLYDMSVVASCPIGDVYSILEDVGAPLVESTRIHSRKSIDMLSLSSCVVNETEIDSYENLNNKPQQTILSSCVVNETEIDSYENLNIKPQQTDEKMDSDLYLSAVESQNDYYTVTDVGTQTQNTSDEITVQGQNDSVTSDGSLYEVNDMGIQTESRNVNQSSEDLFDKLSENLSVIDGTKQLSESDYVLRLDTQDSETSQISNWNQKVGAKENTQNIKHQPTGTLCTSDNKYSEDSDFVLRLDTQDSFSSNANNTKNRVTSNSNIQKEVKVDTKSTDTDKLKLRAKQTNETKQTPKSLKSKILKNKINFSDSESGDDFKTPAVTSAVRRKKHKLYTPGNESFMSPTNQLNMTYLASSSTSVTKRKPKVSPKLKTDDGNLTSKVKTVKTKNGSSKTLKAKMVFSSDSEEDDLYIQKSSTSEIIIPQQNGLVPKSSDKTNLLPSTELISPQSIPKLNQFSPASLSVVSIHPDRLTPGNSPTEKLGSSEQNKTSPKSLSDSEHISLIPETLSPKSLQEEECLFDSYPEVPDVLSAAPQSPVTPQSSVTQVVKSKYFTPKSKTSIEKADKNQETCSNSNSSQFSLNFEKKRTLDTDAKTDLASNNISDEGSDELFSSDFSEIECDNPNVSSQDSDDNKPPSAIPKKTLTSKCVPNFSDSESDEDTELRESTTKSKYFTRKPSSVRVSNLSGAAAKLSSSSDDASSDLNLKQYKVQVAEPSTSRWRASQEVQSNSSDDDDFDKFLESVKSKPKPKPVLNTSISEFICDDEEVDVTSDSESEEEEIFYLSSKSPKHRGCTILTSPISRSITPAKTKAKGSLSQRLLTSNTETQPSSTSLPHTEKTDLFKTPHRPKVLQQPDRCYSEKSTFRTDSKLKPCSFLQSLSTDISDNKRHPDANRYVKYFKKNQEELIKELFKLYNETIFDSKLPVDMEVIWNKRLLKTAGYCAYKRSSGVYTCRVELSTKVCDTPERVRDTLIHELCHAAVWLLNKHVDHHGPYWKFWARKANVCHPELPIISRCHNYSIQFKFTYACTQCGYKVGRHSKSLDTEKKVCGHCHGRFELAQTPGSARGGTPRTPNKFAMFVKENYGSAKKTNSDFKHRDIMKLLSEQFADKTKLNSD